MSICDVLFSRFGSVTLLDLARRMARSWASSAISNALRTACSIGSLSCAAFFMTEYSCAKTCCYGPILTYVCQINKALDVLKCPNSSVAEGPDQRYRVT